VNEMRQEFADEPVQTGKATEATKPAPNDLDTWESDFRAEFTRAATYLAALDIYTLHEPTFEAFKKAFPQRYKALMSWIKATGDAKPKDAI